MPSLFTGWHALVVLLSKVLLSQVARLLILNKGMGSSVKQLLHAANPEGFVRPEETAECRPTFQARL